MVSFLLIVGFALGQVQAGGGAEYDFAAVESRELWIRHPVWGEPSFDAFERLPGNPVHRGSAPYLWPVNGFFFEDPPSGDWYLYVGNYLEGYRIETEHRSMCTAFRSTDRGGHWEGLGPVLAHQGHIYEGESSPVSGAPDVSVVYDQGLYHMCFDWSSENTTWENAANPDEHCNSGVGYAVADRPQGPFRPTGRPIATTRAQKPLLGKYRRLYASSLIRRAGDWLVLTLTDSGPYFGWALAGMTSPEAPGPYTEPVLLLYPESDTYHPPLLEFFPAFVHGEKVYMPATSVAMNRNFVCLFSAPVEEAHRPEAWRLEQHGSMWHAQSVEHEAYGLWGQAFSGSVDREGFLHVLFPTRDVEGKGAINLARRRWDCPFREQGFTVSAHNGPTLVRTALGGVVEALRLSASRTGTVAVMWDVRGPMGADAPRSDASLHPSVRAGRRFLELSGNAWRIAYSDDAGTESAVASGALEGPSGSSDVELRWTGEECAFRLGENTLWQGPLVRGKGALGLYLEPFSHAEVRAFSVHGSLQEVPVTLLYTEALLGAAQGWVHWEPAKSATFRYGEGARSNPGAPSPFVKWNFKGKVCSLWAPSGPEFGKAAVFLNGSQEAILDFHASEEAKSKVVFTRNCPEKVYQWLVIKPLDGGIIPVDCLEVF